MRIVLGAGVTGPGASGARGHLIAFGHPVAPLSRGHTLAVTAINWRAAGFVEAARLAGPHGIGQTPHLGSLIAIALRSTMHRGAAHGLGRAVGFVQTTGNIALCFTWAAGGRRKAIAHLAAPIWRSVIAGSHACAPVLPGQTWRRITCRQVVTTGVVRRDARPGILRCARIHDRAGIANIHAGIANIRARISRFRDKTPRTSH